MDPLLTVNKVSFGISAQQILIENLSIDVLPKTVTFICGANGLGKSTLLKILANFPGYYSKGNIFINTELKSRPVYIPQNYDSGLHIPLSLGDIICAGSKGRSLAQLNKYGLLSEADLKKAWQTASGGEKQKTILVRHLNQNPQILLLDEPTNHLDENSAKAFWKIIDGYVGEEASQRAAIIVIHSEEFPLLTKVKASKVDLNQYKVSA